MLLIAAPAFGQALPTGARVVGGSASFLQTSPSHLAITQTTSRAVIDWNSFSIAAGNSVAIAQPSASSVSVEQVVGPSPSAIFGALSSNGRVVIANPNGVWFGPGSHVDTAGIVATTARMSAPAAAAFMVGGGASFDTPGNAGASVVNEGQLTIAQAGLGALVAAGVANAGVIQARLGRVQLVSGNRFTLDFNGDGLVQVAVDDAVLAQAIGPDGKPLSAAVVNSGQILADGGAVYLTATAVRQAVDNVIDMTGVIEARGVQVAGGEITLTGGGAGTVQVAGVLDASSTGPGQTGGQVSVTGQSVALTPTALVDASGPAGGGLIQIGGGLHGGGTLAHAIDVAIASGAALNAGATAGGKGGTIAVWSDGTTLVAGALSAAGGPAGGDGGMIETSGHILSAAGVSIDAAAPRGAAGTWLLDPFNLNVTTATATTAPSGTNPITYTPTVSGTSTISNATIDDALNAGTSVILTTGSLGSDLGNITVSSPIAMTAASAATLTLNAYGSIIVGAAIGSTGGALAVTLDADTGGAGGYVNITAPITTNGGALIIGGGATPLTGPAVGTAGQIVGVDVAAVLNAGGGDITINGTSTGLAAATGNYGVEINGAMVGTNGAGTITIASTATGNGAGSGSNAVSLQAGGTVTAVDGLISVTGHNTSTSTGGQNFGVGIDGTGSAILSTGTGGVTVVGTGGGGGAGGSNYGVFWGVANAVQSTSTGPISITGTGGGNSTGGSNSGVRVFRGLSITGTGPLTITGTGGGGGGGGNLNTGVNVEAPISADGGSLSITGTGGASSGPGNYGVWQTAAITNTGAGTISVFGTGSGTGGAEIGFYQASPVGLTSLGGNISITGVASAGATGAGNSGVNINGTAISTTGAGTITIAGTATGTGTASGATAPGVWVQFGGTITAVDGMISVTGHNNSTSTGGSDYGVYITGSGSAITSTGTGGMTVVGTGGGAGPGGGNHDHGVYLAAINAVQSTSTGAVAITGTGGGAGDTGGADWGVSVGAALSITGAAPLTITGAGGGAGGIGAYNYGVYAAAAIAANGGALTITGTGGASSGASNYGVYQQSAISNTGAISVFGTGSGTGAYETGFYQVSPVGLTSLGGDISITGVASAGATVVGNSGVNVNGSTISTTGAGTITIAGTATGTGTASGVTAPGVWVQRGGKITAVDGLISVSGIDTSTSAGGFDYGVYVTGAGSNITSTGAGGITIVGVGGGTGAGGSDVGVIWDTPNAIRSTGAGPISVTGTGGDAGGSGAQNIGVYAQGVLAAGGGAISISGTGGDSRGDDNSGIAQVALIINSGAGSVTLSGQGGGGGGSEIGYYGAASVFSATGNLSVTGVASAGGTASFDYGVILQGGAIVTAGAGGITLNGTATGTGTGGSTSGVLLGLGSTVTAVDGLIQVTGLNVSTGRNGANYGVHVQDIGSAIESTGAGGVTITGVGGGFGIGGGNHGVVWDVANGVQSTGSGAITITGAGGGAGGSSINNNGVFATKALMGGGGPISITGAPGLSTGFNYGIDIAAVSAGGGALTLTSTGPATTGALTAASLTLLGVGGGYVLTDPGNAITTLAGDTGAVTYSQSGALTIGTVGGAAGLATTGVPWITTGGDLTIAAGSLVTGASPILAATGGFINASGSAAVVAGSGRWLIYSSAPAADTFGALDSGNFAVWNTAANAAITATGDRYVFAFQPTATITSTDASKVYGVDATAAVAASYTVTGLQGVANAYLADTAAQAFSGAPSVTSTGSAATAPVAGSPYAITAAAGGAVPTDGYALAFASPGDLTVTQAALSVIADPQSRTYGAANPVLTYVETGLVNGDLLTGALATTADATSSVAGSPYPITQGTLGNANYTFTYTGADLTVTPATLTVTAAAETKTYGSTFVFTGVSPQFTSTGLQNSETIGGVTLASPGEVGGASVAGGPYEITASAATGGSFTASNYTIGYAPGLLTVTQAGLAVTANPQTRTYGAGNPTLTYLETGLVNGDVLTGALATTAVATSSVAGSPYAITQGTLAATANYTLAYTGADLTVIPVPLTVTAAAETKTYGSAFVFTGESPQFTSSGLQNSETIGSVTLASLGAVNTADVGASPYGITASAATGGTFTASNYAIGYAPGLLTVTQAGLTVIANPKARTYGAANPTLTYVIGGSGLFNGDMLTGLLATTATATSGVGSYAIIQGTLAVSANYAITYTPANLTVTAATLTAGLTGTVSKVYDGTLAATLVPADYTLEGTLNGDVVFLNDPTAGTYDSIQVGTGKIVTATGLAISGVKAADYILASATVAGPIGIITPAVVPVTPGPAYTDATPNALLGLRPAGPTPFDVGPMDPALLGLDPVGLAAMDAAAVEAAKARADCQVSGGANDNVPLAIACKGFGAGRGRPISPP